MSSSLDTSGFEANAILRGAQLTLVGAHRALQNPNLFTSQHYKQVLYAVLAGVAIRLLVAIPTLGVRVLLRFIGLFTDLDHAAWDEDVVEGLEFIEHSVLQLPFFLMTILRQYSPTMDHLFMDSISWVDRTYVQKHKSEDPAQLRAMYYPNLRLYESNAPAKKVGKGQKSPKEAFFTAISKFGRKAGLSLGIYLLSFLPYVGRYVLPAVSFYTFNKSAGLPAAVVIFAPSIFLPKRYLVMFLQSYFSSRSLMRELLEPYFSRIRYDKQQKKLWFRDRAGVLYGFAIAFFMFLKVPLVGVLIYGIAEASTAYLVTKITEPPPPPAELESFKEKDVRWKNKHEFLNLPLEKLDQLNSKNSDGPASREHPEVKGRAFT